MKVLHPWEVKTSDVNTTGTFYEDYPELQVSSMEQKVQADKPALSQSLQRATEEGF